MLHSVLPFKEPLTTFVNSTLSQKETSEFITPSDWDDAVALLELLQPFYVFTKIVSASNRITINQAYVMISDVERHMKLMKDSTTSIEMITAIDAMEVKFKKYFEEVPLLYYIGHFLDPRYRHYFLYHQVASSDITEEHYNHIMDHIKQFFIDNYSPRTQASSIPSYSSSSSSRPAAKTSMEAYMQSMATNTTNQNTVVEELNEFMRDRPVIPNLDGSITNCVQANIHRIVQLSDMIDSAEQIESLHNGDATDEFDVLQWWQVNVNRYPYLCEMARDVLPIQASSMCSESMFSTSRRVLCDFRSSLTPEKAEKLVCTQSWLRDFKE